MRIQGPPFYLTLNKHKKSYWLNGVCGREGMKTLRYTKKIYLQKLIFLARFLPLYIHIQCLSPKSRLPVVKTKLALWAEKSLARADHLHASGRVLLFPWQGLVQRVIQRAVLDRHRNESQLLLPACPLPSKLTVNFAIWLSPALPLCEQGKMVTCKKYRADCFWMKNVNPCLTSALWNQL